MGCLLFEIMITNNLFPSLLISYLFLQKEAVEGMGRLIIPLIVQRKVVVIGEGS